MKKAMKTICIILIAVMIMSIPTFTMAVGILNNVTPNTNGTDNLVTAGNSIVGVIQVIGVLIAVGIIIVLGIKYMMGSAEEKAEYKKTMIPYFIGAVLLFTGSALLKTIASWATTVFK